MVFSFCYSRLNSGAARHLAKAGALCDPARHPIGRQHDAKCIDWHCEIAGPNGPGNLIVIVRWNEIDQVPEREPHEDRPCLRMRIDCDTCGSNRQKRIAFWECEARTQNAGVARLKRNSVCRPAGRPSWNRFSTTLMVGRGVVASRNVPLRDGNSSDLC